MFEYVVCKDGIKSTVWKIEAVNVHCKLNVCNSGRHELNGHVRFPRGDVDPRTMTRTNDTG